MTTTSLRRALARARAGKSIDREEAIALLQARGEDLTRLCDIAASIRSAGLGDAGRPGVVTYSKKVFVPLTRLCRDRCHYCTFATTPGRVEEAYLTPDQVLDIAREGARLGCKEVLFTLGDRPEDRWQAARDWLDARGYEDTLSYLRAMAILVLEQTGLIPHLNPGVMSWAELQKLKPVAGSMGLMLETTARSLWAEPGGCHYGSPDKEPARRLRTIEDASRTNIPFTTGVLIGIGERPADRVDSLLELRRLARQYGAIQEVIVQNFRSKPGTAMMATPDADLEEYLAVIAVARVLLGPRMRIQAPPNLTDAEELRLLLAAGVDDWGGVSPLTPDHVNPERPWPQLERLAELTAEAGFELRERLAVQPEYIRAGSPWADARVLPHLEALANAATGLAADVLPVGLPWQETADVVSSGRTDLHVAIDQEGRRTGTRGDFDNAFGDWQALAEQLDDKPTGARGVERLDGDVAAALRAAEHDPAGLTQEQALALAYADGPELDALCLLADQVRRSAVGDLVTYVVNRNINFSNVCYVGCRFCAFAQRATDADAYRLSLDEVGERVEQAWDVGATEICMQGGIDPELPSTVHLDLAREVKRRRPDIHLHAFSPMEIISGASRMGISVAEWLTEARAAGVDSLPGTAAEILDDEVRWVLTKGKLPAAEWLRVIRTAHELGIRTTATMMYGHVDEPRHWLDHMRTLVHLQRETGGFTEFVPLPFVHQSSPIYLAGIARPGPSRRDNRAVHALARLLMHGQIDNIECSWVKLSPEQCEEVLRGGANDLGGTLMEETISRMAGSTNGSMKTVAGIKELAAAAGRPTRQRTTTYGFVTPERAQAAGRFDTEVHRVVPLSVGFVR
ncbi:MULTISPECIES: bifunctional FO biosynthesis protein CofGH [unclassified Streptomyces]|uniref:bifunctional FO biosynthesis protein CofGH n=1 Tax=unclassified Streptomyces TaxID=2593676 RepID=UPI00224EAC1F|nr:MULTISPECIES: bifunctional FO biosynthesis protein CofGH [unclassified Streptomyces]MCX5285602.1 bifunctional FO biosynthesis protein CofGH [Streptomyces sp. NBC_00198]